MSDLETLNSRAHVAQRSVHGVVIGVLIGFQEEGRTPLVIFPGQAGDAATPARTTHDVHGAHIGRDVVLMFENADPRLPIIVGLVQRPDGGPLPRTDLTAEIDSDGVRTVVAAREQLVLRCGAASITLTRAGKILIEGTYVSHRSSGVMRIKGGSVQLN
jgi:hypothetical protein